MADANTVATPYTSTQGVSQDQLTNLANEIKKGYSDIPSVRQSIATEVANQEGMLKPLQESKAGLIQQLFEHDKNFSSQYSNPNSATFIENPMARSAGMSAEQAPIWSALSALSQDIASRRGMLGNAITNAVEARKAELTGKQSQLQTLMDLFGKQQEQERFNKSGDIVDVGGRKVKYLNDGTKIDLGPSELTSAQKGEQYLQNIATDAKGGMTFNEMMSKYIPLGIPVGAILQGYNSNSKYGRLQATNQEINDKYGTDLPLTDTESQQNAIEKEQRKAITDQIVKAQSPTNIKEVKSSGGLFGIGKGTVEKVTYVDAYGAQKEVKTRKEAEADINNSVAMRKLELAQMGQQQQPVKLGSTFQEGLSY